MAERKARDDLLRLIANGYDQLQALVDGQDEQRLTAPTLADGWSVRDVLGHVEAWEALLLRWLEATARGETPVRFAPGYPPGEESVDRINATVLAENRTRPVAGVQAQWQRTHEALVAAIDRLSNDDLNEQGRFAWTEDRSLLPYIASNTYEHYDEHLPAIRERLR